jgi:hypothetical protein
MVLGAVRTRDRVTRSDEQPSDAAHPGATDPDEVK